MTSVRDAARMMCTNHVHHLVVDTQRMVRMLSVSDLLQVFEAAESRWLAYLALAGRGSPMFVNAA
ncbi:MAG: signal-transduction protein with cAMP-binding, CBS, and nucleotidyltransferase domain [Acidimicrobiales bacterium]|jgi:signal-transduction protein with cAMP-binding, CBS, and nucleotidyltransferase domain